MLVSDCGPELAEGKSEIGNFTVKQLQEIGAQICQSLVLFSEHKNNQVLKQANLTKEQEHILAKETNQRIANFSRQTRLLLKIDFQKEAEQLINLIPKVETMGNIDTFESDQQQNQQKSNSSLNEETMEFDNNAKQDQSIAQEQNPDFSQNLDKSQLDSKQVISQVIKERAKLQPFAQKTKPKQKHLKKCQTCRKPIKKNHNCNDKLETSVQETDQILPKSKQGTPNKTQRNFSTGFNSQELAINKIDSEVNLKLPNIHKKKKVRDYNNETNAALNTSYVVQDKEDFFKNRHNIYKFASSLNNSHNQACFDKKNIQYNRYMTLLYKQGMNFPQEFIEQQKKSISNFNLKSYLDEQKTNQMKFEERVKFQLEKLKKYKEIRIESQRHHYVHQVNKNQIYELFKEQERLEIMNQMPKSKEEVLKQLFVQTFRKLARSDSQL